MKWQKSSAMESEAVVAIIDKAGGVISRDCICESYAGWEIADIIKERMEKIMK